MKRFVALSLLLGAALLMLSPRDASAQNSYKMGDITVSEVVPQPIAPPEVKNMPPAEFFAWATEYNRKAKADAAANRPVETYRTAEITEGVVNSRPTAIPNPYGYGALPGRALDNFRLKTYEMIYPDRNVSGGALTIFNPYCWEYHTR